MTAVSSITCQTGQHAQCMRNDQIHTSSGNAVLWCHHSHHMAVFAGGCAVGYACVGGCFGVCMGVLVFVFVGVDAL